MGMARRHDDCRFLFSLSFFLSVCVFLSFSMNMYLQYIELLLGGGDGCREVETGADHAGELRVLHREVSVHPSPRRHEGNHKSDHSIGKASFTRTAQQLLV